MRAEFQQAVSQLVIEDERLVVLLGDIGVWAFRESIRDFPERVVNFGILEQAMISFAAGLSGAGYIPIVHSIAPFLVERPLEQIKVDFGYQNLPCNLVSVGGSFDYAALGGTHHSPGDIDALLSVPNVQILIPGHPKELASQIRQNYANSRISYFRLSETSNRQTFAKDGEKVRVLKRGSLGNVIGFGPIMDSLLAGLGSEDLTLVYMNEISEESVDQALEVVNEGPCVVAEPFYQATTAQLFLGQNRRVGLNIAFEGIARSFVHSYGTLEDQLERAGLTPSGLNNRILRHF